MSSAFIPFCAFKTKMGIHPPHVKVDQIDFPICTQFRPTTLDGQQCYELELGVTAEGSGKENGLMLVLDVNEERSKHFELIKDKKIRWDRMDLSMAKERKGSPKIYLDTLSPFAGQGPGTYKMTSLKQISCTQAFLSLPRSSRACSVHNYEECKVSEFYSRGRDCHCVPMALKQVNNQVI